VRAAPTLPGVSEPTELYPRTGRQNKSARAVVLHAAFGAKGSFWTRSRLGRDSEFIVRERP